MTKQKFSILILIISCFCGCAQNENWQEHFKDKNSPLQKYDIDFIKYVAADELTEEFKSQSKFQFLNSFPQMFKIKDESLLTSKYMKKPNDNELLSLYLKRKIGWNSFNRGLSKRSNKTVVYDELENLPSKQELLAFYYSEIFIQILNNQRSINPNQTNLNYDSLGLNKLEGDIMFLSAMRHCGSQISSYSESHFPDNCFRQKSFVSKLPTFNGKKFDNYQLSEFDDFLIHVDKRYPKMSFKERYLPEFEDAKEGYIKCQSIENKN